MQWEIILRVHLSMDIFVDTWITRVKANRHDANEPHFDSGPPIPIGIQDPALDTRRRRLEASENLATSLDLLQQHYPRPWASVPTCIKGVC